MSNNQMSFEDTYTLITFPEMLQELVVDVLDQLSFHVVCAVLIHRLLDRIAKPVLRMYRVDRAVAALDIFALEAVWASSCIAIRVARVLA